MASHGPIIFLEAATNALAWAHFNVHMQLPMALLGCYIHSWTLGGNFLITIRCGPFPSEIPSGLASCGVLMVTQD